MVQVAGSVEVAVRAPLRNLERDLSRAHQQVKNFNDRADRSLQGATRSFDLLGKTVSKTTGALSLFTRQFTFLGTLTTGFALYQVSKQFADFEYNMNTVRGVLNVTGSEFELLNDKAQELGRSARYSAEQVAEAMGLMAKAGLNTGQILNGVSSTLNLAAVEGMDLASATEAVVNIMTGMGLKVTDLDRAIDVLAKTSVDSTTSVAELAYAFKYASGISSTAKLSIEDVSAAFGIMAQNGTKASVAGTALRGIISRLVGPSDEAKKVLKAWNIQVVDAAGNLKPLVEIIRMFEPLMRAGARGLEDLYTVFGARPFQGIAALAKAGADEFSRFKSNLDDAGGTAKRIASTQMEGLKGAFIELGSAAKDLAIAIGESGLGKALESLADSSANAFRSIADGLRSLAPIQQQSARLLGQGLAEANAQLMQIDEQIAKAGSTASGRFIGSLNTQRRELVAQIANIEEFVRLQRQLQLQTGIKPTAVKEKEQITEDIVPAPNLAEETESKRKAALHALQTLESEYLEVTKQNRKLIEVEHERELAKFKELLDKKLITQKQYDTAREQQEIVLQKKLEELRQKDLKFIEDISSAISSGLEGAFRSFIETGKVDFTELTRSILADIATIAIRMAVLQPLFGGGAAGSIGGQPGGAFGSLLSSIFHGGGTAGMSSGVQRSLPASLFIGAPRLHNGGRILGPNEVPTVLERGERVLTPGQRDGANVTVQIVNNSSAQVREESTRTSDGEEIRRFVIEETNRGFTRGAFDGSMRARFGNRVTGTRR